MAERDPFDQPDLYKPRFRIDRDAALFTAGSCFAQHIGHALKQAGFNIIDEEPAPSELPEDVQNRFGYGLYSARFGNIYTLRQFRQLIEEAAGIKTGAEMIWQRGDRYFDALRPGVEPDGLASAKIVTEMRARHLEAVASALSRADVIVFTLGLTEAWVHRATGTVYPTAPGTIAGNHDPDKYALHNFTVAEVVADFKRVDAYLRQVNPAIRWILSVSPVPLAATATNDHVLAATTYSKSVLRAAAGMICENHDNADYFPSYELVTSPANGTEALDDALRSPTPTTVAKIMNIFFAGHEISAVAGQNPGAATDNSQGPQEICEDILIEAFRT